MEGTYAGGLTDRSLKAYKEFVGHLVESAGGGPAEGEKAPTEEQWVEWHAEFWKNRDDHQADAELAESGPTGPSQVHINERARDLGLLDK